MRTHRLLALLVATSGALAFGLYELLAERSTARTETTLAPSPEADAARARRDAELDARSNVRAGERPELVLARPPTEPRRLGFEPPPPDTLRAVRGRVVDAKHHEPVRGIALTLLSRRPRTIQVKTDEDGRFETGADVATGVVAALHAPDASEPLFAARWSVRPNEFLVPPADEGAPPAEIALEVESPERVLEIQVVSPEGTPAAEASVSLSSGRRDEHGLFVGDARAFEVSDAKGRVRFALFGEDAYERSYRVEADHGGTLASDVLEIDPPLPLTASRLDLYPGGVVRVHVKNDEGRPVGGVSLWLSTPEGGRFTGGHKADTDARGEYVFTALRSACWTLAAVHPQTGAIVERQIDLARGAYVDVDLFVTLAGLRLAVTGSVQDELGYPLPGVVIRIQNGSEPAIDLPADAGGRFQYWCHATNALLLGIGGGLQDDHFEPSILTVPFGTEGIVLRRAARLEERTLAVAISDATSGLPCLAASVVLSRDEPSCLGEGVAFQRFSAGSGVAQLVYRLRDDVRYTIDAPGHLRAEGWLAKLVTEAGPGHPLHVALERGFERCVEVRDRVSHVRLSGARLYDEDGLLGVTDATGAITLRAASWPSVVRVEAAGYEALAWDPLAAEWPGRVIWVEPRH